MIRQKIVESFYSLLFNDVWEIWFEQRRWLRMSPILWNKQANFIFVAEILNNYHVNLNKLFELKLPNTNIPTSLFWNEYNFESDLFLIGLSWSHRIRGKKQTATAVHWRVFFLRLFLLDRFVWHAEGSLV